MMMMTMWLETIYMNGFHSTIQKQIAQYKKTTSAVYSQYIMADSYIRCRSSRPRSRVQIELRVVLGQRFLTRVSPESKDNFQLYSLEYCGLASLI